MDRKRTDLQMIVDTYRMMRPGTPSEGPALQQFYARNCRAAKQLLVACNNDLSRAMNTIERARSYYEKNGLNWTLETVVKAAEDPQRIVERKKQVTTYRPAYFARIDEFPDFDNPEAKGWEPLH